MPEWESESDRNAHLDHIRRGSAEAPFLRAALVVLDYTSEGEGGDSPFRAVAYIWRIREEHYSQLEQIARQGHDQRGFRHAGDDVACVVQRCRQEALRQVVSTARLQSCR
jgi:hypothetical protein